MLIPSKIWIIDHWLKFNLSSGNYQNIIIFFEDNKLSFLSTMEINFNNVPIYLHGNGNSKNILEYLSNNSDNTRLIYYFLNYFLNNIIILSYYLGRNNNFNFDNFEFNSWQNMNLIIYGIAPPTTTTTTTLSHTTTTTTLPTTTTTTTSGENFIMTIDMLNYIVTKNGDYITY